MAGPYPGYGPQAASVAAYEPSWFERLIAALATDKSAPEVDAPSGVEYPAGVSAKPLLELSGLAGAARLTANVRAGHPVTNINAPSYAGQYGDVLDTVGLAAPAVALGMKGLAKGAGAVADSFVANSGARARQRGAIRAGGDERLIPSHATDLEGLESARDSLGPNMLYSPSIGINLNKVNRFKDQNSEGTIYLIPKIGAFDPATSASVLYNRDAYLPRHSSYAINQWGGGKTGENLAFDKGLANLRLIGGEGKQIPKSNPESIQMTWSNTAGHKAALANSPHFKSFAQYESSPAGMATLVEGPKQLVKDAVEPLYAAYRKDMREAAKGIGIPMATPADEARFSAVTRPLIYGNRAEREQVLQGLVQAYGPDALTEIGGTAAKYRQRFSRVPAEYAELQPQGLTPLTEENWAGAMVAGKGASTEARGLLNNLPIEWFEPGSLTADAMKRFQGEYGLARRQPIGQRLQLSAADRDPPKTPAPYLTGLAGAYNPAQKGAQKAQEAAQAGPFAWLPDAFAFSGMKVPDDIPEELAIPLWNEKEAAEHLKFIGTQWPLVTNPAAKKNYEVALVGVIQLMDKKGWKPLPETYQVIAGLDEVFPPKVAKSTKTGKPPVWLPVGDWIPDDHMVELQKFAGQVNDTELQQALFDYTNLHPDDVADDTKVHQAAFAKVQAAFAKVSKPWKSWEELGAAKAEAKKPLTSTGDAALDAEIDALAKGLEPAASVDDWLDVSPTGIPWKNVAGSFKDFLDNLGSATSKEQEADDFLDLLAEAGIDVSPIPATKSKWDSPVTLTAPSTGQTFSILFSDLATDPSKYPALLENLLPEVAAHMQANP